MADLLCWSFAALFIAKRILIISQDLKFALNAKQALERDGVYNVTIYSSGKSAVDFLRQNAQDLALVDFRVKDMTGTDMIDHMRAMQPNIAIIAAPDHPAIHELKERYNIQGIINIPLATRKLLLLFEEALKTMYEAQPDTQTLSANKMAEDNRNAPAILEFWLADTDDGDTVLERVVKGEVEIPPEASANFERLLAEEPPMPAFEEGSTIRDLRERLTNLEDIKRILAEAAAEDTSPRASLDPQEPTTDKIPAALILETALDDSTPIRTFSTQEFMSRVRERGKPIEALPSWLQESEKYVREPDFLPLEISQESEILEYTATVTMPSEAQTIEQDPSEMVTDPLEPVQRSRPIEEKQEFNPVKVDTAPQDASTLDETEAEEHIAAFQELKTPASIPALVRESDTAEGLPFADYDKADPRIVQLATTLTQVALELTADATVIARGGKIVAFAGKLPPSDIEDLREQLTHEWSKSEQEEKADKSRILFATLPSSGEEYMISTRSTEAGFTLSLIFSGTRPLHDIRRQSKRLVDALATVPETVDEIAAPVESRISPAPILPIPSTDEVGPRAPIALLWLLADPELEIPSALQQSIIKALDVELTSSGWKVADIQAPDYLYIFAEMPISLKPREILKELMAKTASLIRYEYPDASANLWDDSYLIMQNGRAMTMEEIQRFINFARR